MGTSIQDVFRCSVGWQSITLTANTIITNTSRGFAPFCAGNFEFFAKFIGLPPPRRGRTSPARRSARPPFNGQLPLMLQAGHARPLPRGCHRLPGGVETAWRRTTSAASLLRKHARAVVCPAGANIVRAPVSFHSTVVLRSQPRNARPLQLSSAAPAHPPASHSPSAPTAPSLQWRYRAQSSPPLPSL